jgi:AraC family transcriptional regulator
MDQPGPQYDSMADFYRTGRYAPFVQAFRLAGTAPVALVRFAQPAGEYPDPPTAAFTLSINENGAGRMRFDIGTGRADLPFRRGDLVVTPPGVATFFANDARHQKSFVSLPAALVARLAEETGARHDLHGGADLGVLHGSAFRSAIIARLLDMIWAEAMQEGPHARLFNDGALMALVAALLRLATPGRAAAPSGPTLSAARLARVRDWVSAHLAEPFGLEPMAASACLSPYHFSRALKGSTGLSPRAYVTACRIALARKLLAGTALPLAEVAQACGFADQSSFSTTFSRETGLTPGVYRRSSR